MDEVPVRKSSFKQNIDEWSLVLASSYITYRARLENGEWVLYVDKSDAEKAKKVLEDYQNENRSTDVAETASGSFGWSIGGGVLAALLLGFYLVTGPSGTSSRWLVMGSASAQKIMNGQWWRAVTALFLHAGFFHIATNAASCIIFCSAVFDLYGFGAGSFLVLLSGIAGNFITALIYQTGHVSIGFSTALFGAVGILGATRFVFGKRLPVFRRKAWIYLAAVLALIAFLGVGRNVDLMAHLSGGVAGCVLGLAGAEAGVSRVAGVWQYIFLVLSVAVVVWAWWAAFGSISFEPG
ncbi:MAG: rhomboid family intramembrane serine protease [Spirochaetota bacterium]